MAERSMRERIECATQDVARFAEVRDRLLVVGHDAILLHNAQACLPRSLNPRLGDPIDEVFEAFEIGVLDREACAFHQRAFAEWRQEARAHLRVCDEEGRVRVVEARALGGEDALVFLLCDTTDAWNALSNLTDDERRFRRVADASLDMVTETDENGRFLYASAACEQVLGFTPEQLVGMRGVDLHHPDDVDAFVARVVEGGRSDEPFDVAAHRLRRSDGTWIWVEAMGIVYRTTGGLRRTVGVAHDVSSQIDAEAMRRKLAERVLRSQKLESLGALAGGIAHDFNNLLTPIVGNVGLALLDLPADSPIRKRIEMIKTAATRATALTRQMLTYAGQGMPNLNAVNISTAVEEMALLLEASAGSTARISYDLQCDVPLVEIDATHIGQVAVNLVANASESLPPSGGLVEVRTGSVHADQAYLDSCYIGEDLEKGQYVYVEVADDGSGIPEGDRQRIFDPFFTTRFTGRGLGLAAVDGIVRGYGGAIELMSEEGQGTRIRVLFPTTALASGMNRSTPSQWSFTGESDTTAPRGTILVVDDDENACAYMTEALERAGYRVIQASGGAAAVGLFERHKSAIDAVVLDYTMPLVSGGVVFDSLRKLEPGVRVLVVSGYAQSRAAEELMERGLQGFLQKPFDPARLVREVDRMLESAVDE